MLKSKVEKEIDKPANNEINMRRLKFDFTTMIWDFIFLAKCVLTTNLCAVTSRGALVLFREHYAMDLE